MTENYKQIIFDATSRTYPIDAHVECSYVIKATYSPSKNDWIGLFKVGWSSIRDAVMYEWAPSPTETVSSTDSHGSLLFQASKLPQEDGEFYQFVYFDHEGHMRGASSPFTFRSPRNDDFVEEELADDSDMLVITTRQMQLESELDVLRCEKGRLEQSMRAIGTDRCHLLEKLANSESQLSAQQQQTQQLINQLQEKTDGLQDMRSKFEALHENEILLEQKHKDLSVELEGVMKEKNRLEAQVKAGADEVAALHAQLDAKSGELKTLIEEKQIHSASIADAEQVKRAQEIQLNTLRADMEQQQLQHGAAIDNQRTDTARRGEEVTKLKLSVKMLEEQLSAADERHQVSLSEMVSQTEVISALTLQLEQATTNLQKLQGEKDDWEETLTASSKEKNSLLSTIEALRIALAARYDDHCTMEEDRYVALQAAYSLLKTELRNVTKQADTSGRREAALTDSARKANRRAYELEEKLKLGEAEWKKMAEKNAELQRKLNKAVSARASSGGALAGVAKFARSLSAMTAATGSADLSREELLKIVEQQTAQLEASTAKKELYKMKYLDEKQRAATMGDYYKGEMERYSRELELARSTIDTQILGGQTDRRRDTSSSMSFTYPFPSMECPRSSAGPEASARGTALPLNDEVEPLNTAVDYEETDVVSSEDDNELADRFHDAVDIQPIEAPPESCCVCHTHFDKQDTVDKRSAHINGHYPSLRALDVSERYHRCPMCEEQFEKNSTSEQQFAEHVESHFADV